MGKNSKGLFISFEGTEGCGKTTQLNFFTRYLDNRNIQYMLTREPGGTKIGEAIRKILLNPKNTEMFPETEAYLYASSRAQLVREIIRPNLNKNNIVITDRYVDSSLIYQGIGRNLSIETVKALNEFATGGFYPDITFVILVKPEIGLKRAKKESIKSGFKDGDRLENEKFDFHKRIYAGFKKLIQYRNNIYYIDGEKKPAAVSKDIIKIFEENYDKL